MIPQTVKIYGHYYKIRRDRDAELEDNAKQAMTNLRTKEIYLTSRKDMPESAFMNILLHEIIHAMIYESGTEEIEYDNEEITKTLANGLYQVLVDNKKLREGW
jgi:hypothetical protein